MRAITRQYALKIDVPNNAQKCTKYFSAVNNFCKIFEKELRRNLFLTNNKKRIFNMLSPYNFTKNEL